MKIKIKSQHLKLPTNQDVINLVSRNPVQHNVEDEILHILLEEELLQYNMHDDVDRMLYIKRYDSFMNRLKYIISSKLNLIFILSIFYIQSYF